MCTLISISFTTTHGRYTSSRHLTQINTANSSVPSIDTSGNPYSTQYCSNLDLQCMNGGYQSNYVYNCGGSEPYNCGSWSLNPSYGCTCATGNLGYNCALDSAERCLQPDYQAARMTAWDPSFLNPNVGNKTIQCIIPDTPQSQYLSLMNHRIEVVLNAQLTYMSFTFYSQLSLPAGGCTEVLPVITCSSHNCEFGVLNDGSGDLQLQCLDNTCTSCARSECSTYSFITDAITTGHKAATILLTSQNSADATGNGTFTADTGLLSLSLPIQCQTGQCLYQPPSAAQIAAQQAAAAAAVNSNNTNSTAAMMPISGSTTGEATLSTFAPIVLPTVQPADYTPGVDPTPLRVTIAIVTIITVLLTMSQLWAIIMYRLPRSALKLLHQRELIEPEENNDIEKLPQKQMELTPMLQRKFNFDSSTTTANINTDNYQCMTHSRDVSQLSSSEYDEYNKMLATQKRKHIHSTSTSTSNTIDVTDNNVAVNMSDVSLISGTGMLFKDLTYTIQQNNEPRNVLNSISAYIPQSTFTAVMGPSGSGKTSMMKILAGPQWTVKNAQINGKLYITRTNDTLTSHVSYVQQHENLLYTQTVREALLFSAKLRCPKHYTDTMIQQQIDTVLEQLRITHISDSLIGTPESGGLSGGERRRVSIGIELVTQPGLLLLDEALSGLDSNNAEVCMRVIRDISHSGVSCVLSIHQPSLRLFDMFDSVLLLTRTGSIAYYGPPQQALAHFSTLHYTMPQFITAPEFLLKLASVNDVTLLDEMIHAFNTSELGKQNNINVDKQIELLFSTTENNTTMTTTTSNKIYDITYHNALPSINSTLYTQLYWLSKRLRQHDAREPVLILTQLCMTIGISTLFGGIYWHLDNMIPGIQNRMGYLFFILVYFCLTSMSSLTVFIQSRSMIQQELNASYYSTLSYYICYYCNEILLRLTLPMLFGLISYFMVGLQPLSLQFIYFLCSLCLVTVTSTALCLCVSAMSNTPQQANFICVIILLYCILFGGLFVNNSGAQTMSQLNFTSFIHYIYEAIVVNEFIGLSLLFNPIGVPPTKISGRVILSNYGFNSMNFSRDLWAEFGFFSVFSILSFGIVMIRHRTKTSI